MKKFYRHAIAAPFLIVGTLLLCFSSCMSSDNTEEGVLVTSLPLSAQLEEISSRVGLKDIYDGTFNCYWNGDKLNIYHKYVLNGSVQSMMPLEFATSETTSILGAFSYTGSAEYRYNPDSRIYAFSKGTSGSYMASVADDGTSTLTMPTLASQAGTLTNCATYDALYGCGDFDYNTKLPGLLMMHHLFGALNLHLTSSTFSTSYPVTVTLTSPASNILPGNGGSATLKADGALNPVTGSWSTSWSATITPTSNGALDIYLMTWPFNAVDGTLTVSCSDGTGYVYTDGTITLSALSLAAAQLISKSLEITNAPAPPDGTYSKLYAWDATDSKSVTVGTAPTNYNNTAMASDYLNHASYVCTNCPNANEITWYLSVPCYWDSGSISGGNNKSYIMPNGSLTKAGMWFQKKSLISGFSSTTSSDKTSGTVTILTDALVPSLNLTANYFFLPATGYTNSNGAFLSGGTNGSYWLSTPYSDTSYAYSLGFGSSSASLYTTSRASGYCVWKGQ